MGFKLTTLMVTGTDCTGSCKSNYHMIMTMTAPNIIMLLHDEIQLHFWFSRRWYIYFAYFRVWTPWFRPYIHFCTPGQYWIYIAHQCCTFNFVAFRVLVLQKIFCKNNFPITAYVTFWIWQALYDSGVFSCINLNLLITMMLYRK